MVFRFTLYHCPVLFSLVFGDFSPLTVLFPPNSPHQKISCHYIIQSTKNRCHQPLDMPSCTGQCSLFNQPALVNSKLQRRMTGHSAQAWYLVYAWMMHLLSLLTSTLIALGLFGLILFCSFLETPSSLFSNLVFFFSQVGS